MHPSKGVLSTQDTVDKLCEALNADPRVTEVECPTIDEEFSHRERYYPDKVDAESDILLTGNDAFDVIRLSDPLLLSVHVPKKNQPKQSAISDVPTDDYQVAWDGVSAFVMWEQDSDETPLSGGHVVADILRKALRATGADVHIQACSPACKNIFIHTVMHVTIDKDGSRFNRSHISARQSRDGVNVLAPSSNHGFDLIETLYSDFGLAVASFSEMKNVARRTLDIEASVRLRLLHLLEHYYDHASLIIRPFFDRFRRRWINRGWRREARQLLASLWLSLANAQVLRQEWDNARQEFEGLVAEDEAIILFERDQSRDAARITTMDLRDVEGTVDQIASRLDSRALVMATLTGAIAGAITGALVGLVHWGALFATAHSHVRGR